jgi:NitT/TauT family transport system substrate-binding protein
VATPGPASAQRLFLAAIATQVGLDPNRDITWVTYPPAEAKQLLRFYALRLHEAGMIKSSPQKRIAQGTDWRFVTELKKELKG